MSPLLPSLCTPDLCDALFLPFHCPHMSEAPLNAPISSLQDAFMSSCNDISSDRELLRGIFTMCKRKAFFSFLYDYVRHAVLQLM